MWRSLTFRHLAALGVAAVAIEAALSAATPNRRSRDRVIAHIAPALLPPLAHLLALIIGVALIVLVPRLWRGTSTAVPLAIAGLVALAVLNIVKGLDWDEALLDLSFAGLLAAGRRAFPLGCRNRPRLAVVGAALAAWALTYCALLVDPLTSDRGHTLKHALHTSLAHARLDRAWPVIIEALIASAVAISLVAIRSLLQPIAAANSHTDEQFRAAREIVASHGEDSLSPFILRPDKAFHFAAGGVLAYRVVGEIAVVSGDPVAPPGVEARVLKSFVQFAHRRGWRIVVWGASDRRVEMYRTLGLHALRAGEEAFVQPATFTLQGRRVRKLRQSVHRLGRRGWHITAVGGGELDPELLTEIAAVETRWRSQRRRILGFAMGMGPFLPAPRDEDLFVLARAPEGDLRAVMVFAGHCGKLSLESMRRVGDTPNGLNEAMICHALALAREHQVPEVSLNYAGLGHLFREEEARGRTSRQLARALFGLLGWRFQMARLVRFDNKFQPEWRGRFLIYESLAGLPHAVIRVLQVEGYLPQRTAPRLPVLRRPRSAALPQTDVAA